MEDGRKNECTMVGLTARRWRQRWRANVEGKRKCKVEVKVGNERRKRRLRIPRVFVDVHAFFGAQKIFLEKGSRRQMGVSALRLCCVHGWTSARFPDWVMACKTPTSFRVFVVYRVVA